MNAKVEFNQGQPCDACGRFGAFEFDGRHLCDSCYESSGSCCPEFGREETTACDATNPPAR